jgi:uncharacterized protein YlxW (UPF0749 family)
MVPWAQSDSFARSRQDSRGGVGGVSSIRIEPLSPRWKVSLRSYWCLARDLFTVYSFLSTVYGLFPRRLSSFMFSLLDVKRSGWVWQVTVLSVVLGMLLAAALKTQQTVRTRSGIPTTRYAGLAQLILDEKERNKLLRSEITDLRVKVDRYESASGQEGTQSKLLLQELQKNKLLAGLIAAEGPGVEVTVQDVPGGPPQGTPPVLVEEYLVHDLDLRRIINELIGNGAEAIAVKDQDNEQRIVATSAIRCVGGPIQINGVDMAPPFVITAIGPPGAMASGLNMPNGLLENWHAIPNLAKRMVKISKVERVVVPAYTGSTDLIYAKTATNAGRPK